MGMDLSINFKSKKKNLKLILKSITENKKIVFLYCIIRFAKDPNPNTQKIETQTQTKFFWFFWVCMPVTRIKSFRERKQFIR